jgi:hypothetical protein
VPRVPSSTIRAVARRRTSTSACSWGLGYTGMARWPASQWCPEALEKQAAEAASSRDEAMSSSRGDARAAKRARTGGGEDGPFVPFDEVSGSHGAFAFAFRGSKFNFNLRNLTGPTR